ncbi:efflux transporter outer membrane subunit [Sphingomonas sp. ID0503]|uniref:efflux transporter outer membrane subunit n=1 Tax=Sphingomonas sp. ID0503 TaxID=3399691 RepID=UPI003AFAE60F
MKTRALLPLLLLGACSMAPKYERPATVAIPASFKEAPGWQPASPQDAALRGDWWTLFDDPVLSDLEQRVARNNQNIAAAVAAYDQARALVKEQRAGLFPTLTLNTGYTQAGTFGEGETSIVGGSGVVRSGGSKRYEASIGASWEPDLWGAVRSAVTQARGEAEASQADIANTTLSAQGELALNYVQLRAIDAQIDLLDATTKAYQRALTITTNRYNQGVAGRIDVLQAETQLRSARADAADLGRQRAVLEHAIAVLVGENPSTFVLAKQPRWTVTVPAVPAILPATLLERRPDIAAAERRVAAANAAIGIQRAAFFPTIGLSGDVGYQSSALSDLFKTASSIWSFGLNGVMTLLDFGARSARVTQARAAHEQAVATYRQTVLTAFQNVEDQLSAAFILARVAEERSAAAVAADRAEQISQNQYLAGQIGYADVILQQTTALSARRTAVTAQLDRQTAAVALIQAIGGGWTGSPPR